MKYPSIIVLFTSYRCNARCIMCSAWRKQRNQRELSPGDIERIFSDKILSKTIRIINVTGGEPTLRDDLIDIVKILTERCANLERIDVSTNGINTIEVIDRIEQILAYLLKTEIRLTVSISVDGIGSLHDTIRGTFDAFKGADNSIEELKELMLLYSPFSVGMNATINKLNFGNLNDILDYSIKKGLGINFTLSAISEIGVESLPLKDSFRLNSEEKKIVSLFIENLLKTKQINNLYGSFLLCWLKTGLRKERCAFREGKSVLCEPDGSVYRCGNFKDFKIGNLLEKSFKRITNSKTHFLKEYNTKCKTCNSNCYMDVT